MQATTDRHANLASLVPENAIDPTIRISSLDGWTKIEQIGDGAFGAVYKYSTNIKDLPIAAGKHLKVQLLNLNEKKKADLKSVSNFNNFYVIKHVCNYQKNDC